MEINRVVNSPTAVVYPRVKVRVQKEEDDQYAYESLPSLKAFESLSINDFSSSDDSPTPVVRIPRACILSPDRHGLPSSRGRTKDNNQSISGGSRTNARATSVPRPRAVLSSPVILGPVSGCVYEKETHNSSPVHGIYTSGILKKLLANNQHICGDADTVLPYGFRTH
ncbi:hypothetical protein RND71_040145 [Anisodus tanguticus]|uniref:Uncharacterized protein n=1 Tax=Anisodus tanguticus TaxID=243964 RepID=A0AAE1QYQ9_9SOLA|nr:hypothetical protein RND71_040145 [Anisodus tanguticus]